jgi:hypothetical protein
VPLPASRLLQIGRVLHGACRSVCADMAPDEFTLITALKQLGLVRSVHSVQLHPGLQYAPGVLLNCYPTSVVFPAESSPHPVLWTDWETQVLCQVSIC